MVLMAARDLLEYDSLMGLRIARRNEWGLEVRYARFVWIHCSPDFNTLPACRGRRCSITAASAGISGVPILG